MRHCTNSYQILCPACKSAHNSHLHKLVGIVELQELTKSLIDKPFNKAKDYLFELVNVM